MKYAPYLGNALKLRVEALAKDTALDTLDDELKLLRCMVIDAVKFYDRAISGDELKPGFQTAVAMARGVLHDCIDAVRTTLESQSRIQAKASGMQEFISASMMADLVGKVEEDISLLVNSQNLPGTPNGVVTGLTADDVIKVLTQRMENVAVEGKLRGTRITPDQMVGAMDSTIGEYDLDETLKIG